jgi:hypothetical protein
MKVKEVLSLAAGLLNKTEAQAYLERGESADVTASESEVRDLVTAYAMMMNVAARREPLSRVYIANNVSFVPFADLPDTAVEISAVTDIMGREIPFELKTDGIGLKACEDAVRVQYYYIPTARGIDDDCDYGPGNKLTALVLAYGVVSEYLALKNSFTLAEVWMDKFEKGMAGCLSPKGKMVMPRRPWW